MLRSGNPYKEKNPLAFPCQTCDKLIASVVFPRPPLWFAVAAVITSLQSKAAILAGCPRSRPTFPFYSHK